MTPRLASPRPACRCTVFHPPPLSDLLVWRISVLWRGLAAHRVAAAVIRFFASIVSDFFFGLLFCDVLCGLIDFLWLSFPFLRSFSCVLLPLCTLCKLSWLEISCYRWFLLFSRVLISFCSFFFQLFSVIFRPFFVLFEPQCTENWLYLDDFDCFICFSSSRLVVYKYTRVYEYRII